MVGGPIDEVLGAINRIDGEGVICGHEPLHDRAILGVGLLAKHDCIGEGCLQSGGDQHLGFAVGNRDQIAGVLLVDLVIGQCLEAWSDDFGCNLLQQGQDRLGVHLRSLCPVMPTQHQPPTES